MELKIFKHAEFGSVRMREINNEPWFVAKDVCNALGYTNPRKAISDHIEEVDRDGVTIRDAIGREQRATVINESGLYSLILGSRLESAKRFKHWVTSEVLPSVRKNGGYMAGQEKLSGVELMAQAVLYANKMIEEQQQQITRMRPKEIFADSVAESGSTILVGDLAKILKGNGIDMGQNRLFQWLRDHGYLCKSGSSWNMPTQRSMDMGLFKIKETSVVRSDGGIDIKKTTKVTGKGQQFFINKFLGSDMVPSGGAVSAAVYV